MTRRKAFTLIELLVVVAIIALLIAILLPSLGKARDRARGSVCLANLKGLNLAFVLYASVENGYMPWESGTTLASYNDPATGNTYTNVLPEWFGAIYTGTAHPQTLLTQLSPLADYWGKATIGGCPSVTQNDYPNTSTGYRLYYGPINYAYNAISGGLAVDQNGGAPRQHKISEFTNPSTKAIIWDSSRLVSGLVFSRTPWGYGPRTFLSATATATTVDPNLHGRHNKQGNVAWLDGHAEPFTPWIADLSQLGTTTFSGSSPPVQGAADKNYNIGYINDGPTTNMTSLPNWQQTVNKYYDPLY